MLAPVSDAPDDPALEEELVQLDRHLRAVAELPMRRERLLEALEARSAEAAYVLVAAVMERPGQPAPHLQELREALTDLLARGGAVRPLEYALRAGIYAAAAAREDDFVMRLLRAPGAAEVMDDPGAALPRRVAELPLGVRRALARGHEPAMLERLLLDPDEIVVGHLLENPRITEEHVVRIAARRPIAASTLRAIQASRRFGARPRVRTALARNPYCPTDLAVQLLALLPLAEVRSMAGDATLHDETRHHARDELARRGSR